MDTQQNRPLGVTVVGTIEIIKGFLGLILYFQKNIPEIMPWITAAVAPACIIKIILGIGLLRLRAWARQGMVIFISLLIVAMVFILVAYPLIQLLQNLILSGLCLALIIIYYLTRPYVKALF